MKFQLDLSIQALAPSIEYGQKIMLIGSCFTEHIADRLQQHRFEICSNPNGILFNPLSVADSLEAYLDAKQYQASDLFYLNELWNSWDHHTRFSDTDVQRALNKINAEQAKATSFLHEADYLIITLGSAFQYYLHAEDRAVANNHRAPGQWFEKRLLLVDLIVERIGNVLARLKESNPQLRILFTISPVRHIRDGLVENNRSKARLIEAVHQLCEQHPQAVYFPAYEILIDVLRDYRFYDIDLVHPNYAATSHVWDLFCRFAFSASTQDIMQEIGELHTAMHHKTRFPDTQAHRDFCTRYTAKVKTLQTKYPGIALEEVLDYFESQLKE